MTCVDRDKVEGMLHRLINSHTQLMQTSKTKQACAGSDEAEHYARMEYSSLCKRMAVKEVLADLGNIEDVEAIPIDTLIKYQKETGNNVLGIIDWWTEHSREEA